MTVDHGRLFIAQESREANTLPYCRGSVKVPDREAQDRHAHPLVSFGKRAFAAKRHHAQPVALPVEPLGRADRVHLRPADTHGVYRKHHMDAVPYSGGRGASVGHGR